MASEKQIAANRANAKRSTGPKTIAGKRRSSQNAYMHGLSRSLLGDPNRNKAGREAFALANLELLRVRQVRSALLEELIAGGLNAKTLWRLASLDRYERLAFTQRRRAERSISMHTTDTTYD